MTLYRTGEYRDLRSTTSDLQRVDAAVSAIDLEIDAPDDVIDVVPEPAGVAVELIDTHDAETLGMLSNASRDRLAAERAVIYLEPQPIPSQIMPVTVSYQPPYVNSVVPVEDTCQPVCNAPCAEPSCVTMADEPCDPSPGARCARSLERVGVSCQSPPQCDEVCPMVEPTPALTAGDEERVSTTDQVCQTEPMSSSRATSLDTGTETETDFDQLQSDETEDIGKVRNCSLHQFTTKPNHCSPSCPHHRHHQQQQQGNDISLLNKC